MFPMFAWGNFGKNCDDFNFQNYTGTFKKRVLLVLLKTNTFFNC